MKIAIAHENGKVCAHFGRAPEFVIAELENDQVVQQKIVSSPGHGHGIIPHFLAQQGVQVIIAGGMGEGALQMCAEYGIEPILSIQGTIPEVLDQYIRGQLKSVPIPCENLGHKTRGECHQEHHRGGCH